MKRLLSALAALLLAAVLILPAAVRAEAGAIFTMNDAENIAPGDTFDITLHISGDYEAHGMSLSVEFDPTALVLESCVRGDYLKRLADNDMFVVLDCQSLANAGKIKLGILCPVEPASGEGDVFTMRFRLKEGVTVNQQVIMIVSELSYLPIGEIVSTDVAFTTDNAIITVVNGTTPEGGYNDGTSGVGGNPSDSPNYPTRDPEDPDSQVTPAADVTLIPLDTSAPVTNAPDPAESIVPGTVDPQNTDEAAGTGNPVDTQENTPPTQEGSAEGSKQGGEISNNPTQKKNAVPFIVLGAVVVAGAVAAALVIGNRKNKQ